MTDQSSLRASKLKAKLEAKLGEEEPATDPRLQLDYSPYANEKKATYDVVFSVFLGPDEAPKISVHIEYLPTPFVPRQHSQPLFRWIHLTQNNMDFDHFTQCAQSMLGLPNDQIQGVLSFLQRVRSEMEMPVRCGNETMGNYMRYGLCVKREGAKKADGLLPPTYVFCSMPYHKLAPYSRLKATGNSPAGNPRLHPVLTLLQTKNPSTTKQRDLQQAVRSVGGKSTNDVFHVARLWFLIINNKFIITSANGLSGPMILGEHSNLTLIPRPRTQRSYTSIAPQVIQVLINNRIYVLPLSQCDSWFKFTQSFVKYTKYLHDQYTLKCRGIRVTQELWPVIVHQAKSNLLCVVISPRKRIITRGLSEGVVDGELDSTLRPQPYNGDKLSGISEADSIRSSDTYNDKPLLEKIDSDNEGPRMEMIESDKDEPLKTGKIPRKDEPKPTGSNRNSSPQASHSRNPTSAHPVNLREFHILIWIALSYRKTKLADSNSNAADEQPDPTSPQVRIDEMPSKSDGDLVNDYLKFMHSWLENRGKRKARTLYHKSTEKTLHDVERAMLDIVKSRVDLLKSDSKSRLIQAVKSIFALFLPLDRNDIMCSKLWGALHMVVTAPTTADEYSWRFRTDETVKKLVEAAKVANAIKVQLSAGNAPPPSELIMPPNALRAWQELLLCLLFWSQPDINLSCRHATRALLLLRDTHDDILTNPTAKELLGLEAVLPNGLVAIMMNRVVADFTDRQLSLVDTYFEYFKQLEVKLGNKLLNRGKQATIHDFIQELKIVHDTLLQQIWIERAFRNELINQEDVVNPAARGPWPLDQGDFLLMKQTDMTLRRKIDVVEELLEKAGELLESSDKEVRVQKDTQERLIYTFTIVTIIFLPLSTVATILGMNTVDVRNMDNSQSLFWATALPLTAVVITVSLFVSGIVTWPFETWPFRRDGIFVGFKNWKTSDSLIND